MGEPYVSVPVSVNHKIACRNVNGAYAVRRKHFFFAFKVRKDSIFLLFVAGTCNNGVDAVKTLVEVFAVFSEHKALRLVVFVMKNVAEVTAFLVPGILCKSVCEPLNVVFVNGNVFINAELSRLRATDDRPLSDTEDKLVRLYNERIGIYQATADIVVPDMETAEAEAEYIIRKRTELIR